MFFRRFMIACRGKLIQRLVPAFPRYIFIPLQNCLDVVNDIVGFVGIVMFGNSIARVHPSVLEDLSAMSVDGVMIEEDKPSRFRSGDSVRIASLDTITVNRIGKYHRPCGNGRAVVLFDCMGRLTFVNVDEKDICETYLLGKKRRRRNGRSRHRKLKQATDLCSAL